MADSNTHRIGTFDPCNTDSYLETQGEVLATIERRQKALLKALDLLAGQLAFHPGAEQSLDDIAKARAAASKLRDSTRRMAEAIIAEHRAKGG